MNARFLGLLTVSLCGCGVILGIADVPTPNDSGSTDSTRDQQADDGADSGADANADAVAPKNDVDPGPCVADAHACDPLALGWSPALLSTTVLSCPSTFNGTKVAVDWTLQQNACSCAVGNMSPPSCVKFDRYSGAQCNGVLQGTISANGCANVLGNLDNIERAISDPPTGGSCTGVGTPDTSKLSFALGAICEPTMCRENVCGGTSPSSDYQACIKKLGDVACDQPGFAKKHLMADNVTMDCSQSCSCAAGGTCTNGTVSYFDNANCSMGSIVVQANGSCLTTSLPGRPFMSVNYIAQMNPTYTPSFVKQPALTTPNLTTLCCTK